MASRSFDAQTLKIIVFFEKITDARLKDYLPEHSLFIVEQGEMGRAIGKNAANIRKVEQLLKRSVQLVEFNSNLGDFIRRLAHPAEIISVEEHDGIVTIRGRDTKAKGMIIGREHSKLNLLKEIVKRHFPVTDIKVV
ncbi:TPA: NusA-like transcription termination signal-binding factor [Candidatus Woesearchaeota archaeon]|nr:MAG: NusA protein-like protein [archaeon GW2011_AR11]HIH04930.1 NusA-like transcription termination signal-binding factor [Candidatus Woesearchaeota archaeon]HII64789.1 NusA-like transcription termination signal-binding factor [Candidatus Woesearchaeota archaeon]HII65517.1 NusA-like transcription termination signal-binding factor [Candidatus Woesearchaeota archaeon]